MNLLHKRQRKGTRAGSIFFRLSFPFPNFTFHNPSFPPTFPIIPRLHLSVFPHSRYNGARHKVVWGRMHCPFPGRGLRPTRVGSVGCLCSLFFLLSVFGRRVKGASFQLPLQHWDLMKSGPRPESRRINTF